MSVLTIASSKGGPGKTTVAMLLAGRLAADGFKIAAIDADPAGAFMRWAQNTYEGPRFAAFAETDETQLAHLIDTENQTADLVLVDTAGFGNRAAAVAMTSADAVLIPTLAGEPDITEAARVLLNRVRRTQLARHAAREIASAALPMLAATLADLVAYGEMTFSGRIPDQGLAAEEVTRLAAELRAIGWIPQRQDVLT